MNEWQIISHINRSPNELQSKNGFVLNQYYQTFSFQNDQGNHSDCSQLQE